MISKIVPKRIRQFATIMEKIPERWHCNEVIEERLRLECNKDMYIKNVCSYITSLKEILSAWEQRFIKADDLDLPATSALKYDISPQQRVVINTVKDMLR